MDSIDIVIPFIEGKSEQEDMELRYCLRSIEKYLKNYRSIIIVGDCPNWVKEVIHIPYEGDSRSPSANIMTKLLKVCDSEFLTNKYFVYFNDDYFLLKDMDANKIPFYYNSTLNDTISLDFENWYNEYLINTDKVLEYNSMPRKNYDLHYPIIIHKDSFISTMRKTFKVFWFLNSNLLVKSLYCNRLAAQSEPIEDCKVRANISLEDFNSFITGKFMFSTGNECLYNPKVRERIMELYPEKSKYEKY